jgi:hypothetical protein
VREGRGTEGHENAPSTSRRAHRAQDDPVRQLAEHGGASADKKTRQYLYSQMMRKQDREDTRSLGVALSGPRQVIRPLAANRSRAPVQPETKTPRQNPRKEKKHGKRNAPLHHHRAAEHALPYAAPTRDLQRSSVRTPRSHHMYNWQPGRAR